MLVTQNSLNPSAVLDAITDAIPLDMQELFVAAAYVTREGSDLLIDRLRRRLGAALFSAVPKRLVAASDYGLTDPDAMDDWSGLGARVDLANGQGVQNGSLNPSVAYHPKVYAFRTGQGDWQLVAGSANLTARGLTINSEAVTRVTLSDDAFRAAVRDLTYRSVRATPDLLNEYRQLRVAQAPPAEMLRELAPVAPPPPAPAALQVFGDAATANAVNPRGFNRFWVQTLSISGGSGSQVELPRGANWFFGFNFMQHVAGDKVTIGQPRLISGRQSWTDRILSWHGNNRMERINMPTLAMGGYNYQHSAVCFLRRQNGFEFFVAAWQSNLARSWRTASNAAGHTFKLGETSPRLCGLL